MPLLRPVTQTKISTTDFGQPVYDALVRAGATRSGVQASFPTSTLTSVSWTTVVTDTGGFVSSATHIAIPAGKDGLYVAAVEMVATTATGTSYLSLSLGSSRYDIVVSNTGFWAATITRPLAAGESMFVRVWNGYTGPLVFTTSRLDFYRVGL